METTLHYTMSTEFSFCSPKKIPCTALDLLLLQGPFQYFSICRFLLLLPMYTYRFEKEWKEVDIESGDGRVSYFNIFLVDLDRYICYANL